MRRSKGYVVMLDAFVFVATANAPHLANSLLVELFRSPQAAQGNISFVKYTRRLLAVLRVVKFPRFPPLIV